VALVTGWLAVVLILLAAMFPIGFRLRSGRRAAPSSGVIRAHVAIGLGTSVIGFFHAATLVAELGSPGAVAGGAAALAPGAFAFFVLVAHTGIGLQLRDERSRDRPRKRRLHRITASLIVIGVAAHVVALRI
jgi:hypothetical protein